MKRGVLLTLGSVALALVPAVAYAQQVGSFDVQNITPWGVIAMVFMQLAGTVQQRQIKEDLPGKEIVNTLKALQQQTSTGSGIASILTTHMGQDIQQLEQIQRALSQISSNLTRINAEIEEAEKVRARNHEALTKQLDNLSQRVAGVGG